MIMFAKMQMPFTISTIFTCCCDDWRDGVREHEFAHAKHGTLHPYQWRQKNPELHHVQQCTLPNDHNTVGVSLSNLWADYICIEKDYEL